jgi:hypothetical protein
MTRITVTVEFGAQNATVPAARTFVMAVSRMNQDRRVLRARHGAIDAGRLLPRNK